jgi:hypothetical protein
MPDMSRYDVRGVTCRRCERSVPSMDSAYRRNPIIFDGRVRREMLDWHCHQAAGTNFPERVLFS